ncbi:polygalacturonase 1 beta-like protein 3 [Cucurbita moschata]|uniref:Polygalacturonase 1 beta-like protein 3 n=1 Tax=Cucurbita moschata TaxID=3662 RepID=A0A6J1HB03_CUCMO|nr:polygalacturonase 1 beta-like protein 3 [Cucurbita moschata]
MHTLPAPLLVLLYLFIFLLSPLNVPAAADEDNPFTPKAFLNRYWNKEVRNDLPKPTFLFSKVSPLTAVQSAAFAKLAAQNALSSRLPEFCSAANLLCFPDLSPSLAKHDSTSNFAVYSNKNFTTYGTQRSGGIDSFKNYSNGDNVVVDSFRRYSHEALGHTDQFSTYGTDTNVPDQSFNTYASKAVGGNGGFTTYEQSVNVPNLRFTTYSSDATGRSQSFKSYSENANAGDQSFVNYGKRGNGGPNEFTGYGTNANVIGSGFSSYGANGNGANDTFTNYGNEQNNPQNNFRSYGDGGNGAIESFSSYRDQANVGDDSFQSYSKNSNSAKVNFANYGKSFNEGTDKFSGYGQNGNGQSVGFKTYGVNTTFKDYAKQGISFAKYSNVSSGGAKMSVSESLAKRWVEPGKFFRESMLRKGTVMAMPDIRDKMPKRSFLPRSILSKLPFSSSKLEVMKQIFHAGDNSSMETMMTETLRDCERTPSAGETKRCVGSVEDMIDFATSVLGRNVVVRTTENTKGSKGNIMIGAVKGIEGGKVTESVSCHQSLFPYLLYYCHSVPKVRVYEAELLDPTSKATINHGVAICHLDTSAWSPAHGAFIALGSAPGRVEVCHWIFENDMTWSVAD